MPKKPEIYLPSEEEDAAINRGIEQDPDTYVPSDEQFSKMKRRAGRPRSDAPKVQLTVRYDADIVEKFKAVGEGWQTRMNNALRESLNRDKTTHFYLVNVLSRRDASVFGRFEEVAKTDDFLLHLLIALGSKGYAINYELKASAEVFKTFSQVKFDKMCETRGFDWWSGVELQVRDLFVGDHATGASVLLDTRHDPEPIMTEIAEAFREAEAI
ncbi:hypothetical protein EHZ19_26915 [Paraburkholderia bannensis]|nr:hypothetical protein EHZ19_26915 [Paraburkholderia bannensis]